MSSTTAASNSRGEPQRIVRGTVGTSASSISSRGGDVPVEVRLSEQARLWSGWMCAGVEFARMIPVAQPTPLASKWTRRSVIFRRYSPVICRCTRAVPLVG